MQPFVSDSMHEPNTMLSATCRHNYTVNPGALCVLPVVKVASLVRSCSFHDRAADVSGHGSGSRRVEGLRKHGLPQEEHVLQHALADCEEARRARDPEGKNKRDGIGRVVKLTYPTAEECPGPLEIHGSPLACEREPRAYDMSGISGIDRTWTEIKVFAHLKIRLST